MKNTIILGSGRSGTSMVAGVLSKSGYYMGEQLYAPRHSNSKGFFESRVINWINEDLLAPITPGRPPVLGRWWFRDRPMPRQRWLARIPPGTPISCPSRIAERIEAQIGRAPFCFKDPRFCYTLPAWRSFLKDAAFVCVFRPPMVTAASIVKECATMPYLRNLMMNTDIAIEVWVRMYQHVLQCHRHQGEWLFLHYDQVLRGDGMDRLERFLDAPVDRSFPDASLRRSRAEAVAPAEAERVYEELCGLAGYAPG